MKLSSIVFSSIIAALLTFSFIPAASAETSITSPVDGSVISVGACGVTGTANDPDGVAFVLVSTDGGTTWKMAVDTSPDGSWATWSFQFSPPGEGPCVILARATDALGAQEAPGAKVAVRVGGSIALAATPLGGSSIVRVSVASDGTQGISYSSSISLSADGRYAAFESLSPNLVLGDTNSFSDVFVHDLLTGVTERVSVSSDGTQGNSESFTPSISADGRYVAFTSFASNLVGGDTNGTLDVFVHDRSTGETSRVNIASDGSEANSLSYPSFISADGNIVVFSSFADNLVPGDTNGYIDAFIHDRATGATERVSVASDGSQGNFSSYVFSVSADGRYAVFYSEADNLVNDDTNGSYDIFVHDRVTGGTERISVASDGTQGNDESSRPSISADGRYVTFGSWANNLVPDDTNYTGDVFVHDRQTGETSRVSVSSEGNEGDCPSRVPSISADGRFIAFNSCASNLVPGITNGYDNIFVHDRATGQTIRVNTAYDGAESNEGCYASSISADGRYVGINSIASNLVPGDTNGMFDAFVAVNPLHTSLSLTHSQDGKFVTMNAEFYDGGAPAADANIKFYCSTDGGLTWRGRGRAVTDALGVATKIKRFREGSYLIKAVYAPRGEVPVESNIIDCTVASVVALSPEHRTITSAPAPTVTWEPFPGATGYILQTSSRRSFRTDVTEVPVGLVTSAALPAMLPDTKTFWRVVATIPEGLSVGSNGRLIKCMAP